MSIMLFYPTVLCAEVSVQYNDSRGSDLFEQAFDSSKYWKDSLVYTYNSMPYDEIRLKNTSEGYVSYISGSGRENFQAELVADTIYRHQDLIPEFMPALKAARYIGRGVDAKTGLEYTDIYFLADIKLFL